ncbi:LysM peptidoglycan-binding domain-containing protein [Flavobacteriales bacterium]|nr:LysM peptidoglycan-binding domain-containing protein [Flavobacteriales bacterium]
MKNLLTAVLILLSFSLFSQERREMIDGDEFIVHTVKIGETLYGISKKYKVTKKDLRGSNSGMLLFIKIDQEIRVPVSDEARTIHIVKKGETLYGIAKQYKMTTEKLVILNPEKAINLKVGDYLDLKSKAKPPVYEKVNVKGHEKSQPKVEKTPIEEKVIKKTEPIKEKVEVEKTVIKDRVIEKAIPVKEKVETKKAEVEEEVIEKAIPVKEKVLSTTEKAKTKAGGIHVVKKGETLYGISRKYKLSLAQLLTLNPQIVGNAISIGDKLNVPAQSETKKEPQLTTPVLNTKQVEYKVEKGETLYGISRKFNTTVEEITKANPTIKSLKEGDILKINVPQKGTDQIKIDLGKANTTDSLDFNKVNKINPLKDKLNEMVKKETYTVSMFLPLMLDKNDRTPVEPNKPRKIYPLTEMSTHFYQGAMLALDSIRISGVSIDLNVYDTEKDTNTIGKLLRTEKLKSSDLIIGPFYEKPYAQVANFSKNNQIQTVCPVSQSNKILFNNKYVTELQTSLPTQLSYLAKYIANNKNTENVICVSGKTKKDKYLSSMFSEKYNGLIASKSNNYRSKASTYKMTSFSSISGFDSKLVKGKKNILIIPFTEEGMATSFFTQLNIMMTRSRMRGYEVEVYALENFMEFENINVDLKMKYNLHVTSSSFIDYKADKTKDFIMKYRAQYGTEPTKYAFAGFDVTFYHALAMSNYGKNFSLYYNQIKVPLLQSTYLLERTDNTSGFENQTVFVLAYKEYELVKVN